MAIKTKNFTVGETTYQITQHPAVEGCELLEKYGPAINAFLTVSREPSYTASNRVIYPFVAYMSGSFLGLLMFMDKLADPSNPVQPETDRSIPTTATLTVKEIKAGLTLADRQQLENVHIALPLSKAVGYTATDNQELATNVDGIFDKFFSYVTLDGVQVEVDSLSYEDMAALLAHILVFNFLHIWSKPRFSLPANWSSGVEPSRAVKSAQASYSQSNVIYTILQSSLELGTYTDLKTKLNTEDAFDMNEAALLAYYEQAEAHKEAERQAKQQSRG